MSDIAELQASRICTRSASRHGTIEKTLTAVPGIPSKSKKILAMVGIAADGGFDVSTIEDEPSGAFRHLRSDFLELFVCSML